MDDVTVATGLNIYYMIVSLIVSRLQKSQPFHFGSSGTAESALQSSGLMWHSTVYTSVSQDKLQVQQSHLAINMK